MAFILLHNRSALWPSRSCYNRYECRKGCRSRVHFSKPHSSHEWERTVWGEILTLLPYLKKGVLNIDPV